MIVWTNIAHGLLAFFWAHAARRVLRPRCPELAVTLSTLVLAVPLAVLLVQAVAPAPWTLVRVEGWRAALATAGLAAWAPIALAGGTGLLFVAQELLPLMTRSRGWRHAPRNPHPRLDVARAAVQPGFRAMGLDVPPVRCTETSAPVAALVGLRAPSSSSRAGWSTRSTTASSRPCSRTSLPTPREAATGG